MKIYDNAVKIATETYFWKPYAAFFLSIELSQYLDSKIIVNGPILDLACGDGGIIKMLKQLGIVNEPAIGLDINHIEINKAKRRELHSSLYLGSIYNLPFADNSFSSIICNDVLSSIPGGTERALEEVNRVLKKDGTFIATVATDKFVDIMLIPKILSKISTKLERAYVKKFKQRWPLYRAYPIEKWTEQFENIGFRVEETKLFLTPKEAQVWNIFTLNIFRVFSITKLLENSFISKLLGKVLEKVFCVIFSWSQDESKEFGFIYITAKK